MVKYNISEEEKKRILNLHEDFKKGVLTEQYTKVEGPFTDKLSGLAHFLILKQYVLYTVKGMIPVSSSSLLNKLTQILGFI